MADDGFNGSSVDWYNGASITLGPLRSISYRESGAKVAVHGAADSQAKYKTGIPDPEVVVSFVGCVPATSCDIGDTGALTIAWNDGGAEGTLSGCVVTDRSCNGNMDGEIISEVSFAPDDS